MTASYVFTSWANLFRQTVVFKVTGLRNGPYTTELDEYAAMVSGTKAAQMLYDRLQAHIRDGTAAGEQEWRDVNDAVRLPGSNAQSWFNCRLPFSPLPLETP